MSDSNRIEALASLKTAVDARIAERLAHYEALLTNGTQLSGETLLEIFEFLKLVMPQGTPAKEPSHEPRHWKRGEQDKVDANPNTRVEFHDNP